MIPDYTFDSITDVHLRAYNRVMYTQNLLDMKGVAYADNYIKKFDSEAKKQMAFVASAIKKLGAKFVREAITENTYHPEYR